MPNEDPPALTSGDYVGGQFLAPAGEPLTSTNPATGEAVFVGRADPGRIADACGVARQAFPGWRDLGFERRVVLLRRFAEVIRSRADALAEPIRLEVGKVQRESREEIAALVARVELTVGRIRADLPDGPLAGYPAEMLRHQPHGVVGVIGPFNFPLHLCHAHVVPALLLGNTVVMKPSEVAPLTAVRYAEAAAEAGLPPGVINVVQGTGAAGAALVADPNLRALAFTGSWPTGRRILEATLDRPEVLVALEMGGKNTVVVCEDSELRQTVHEILVGGYLTTGQRCTCTDRVLVHGPMEQPLLEALAHAVASLRFGDPLDPRNFGGPLVTRQAKKRFESLLEVGRAAGAEEVARGQAPAEHAFVAPVLHRLPSGVHQVAGYTDTELFGPAVHVERVESDEEAIGLLEASPFGFANSVFTADRKRFDRYARDTTSGLLNWNRSTNRASPRLPFGGTRRSGNFRPAGAYAARNLAVPVAIQLQQPGAFGARPELAAHLPAVDLEALETRHRDEEQRERSRVLASHPRPLALRAPEGGTLPESETWLARLYAGERVPREKKPVVFDHLRSVGPWFVSLDREPLSVLDAMAQTATLPGGFADDAVLRAYVEGGLGGAALGADDTSLGSHEAEALADRLRELVPGLPQVTFANSGSEACEKAFALCLAHAREGARKVLAFEGGFHGRTLLSLHATHSPAKREPFELAGYQAEFAPFPVWWTPHEPEPPAPNSFWAAMADGKVEALGNALEGAGGLLAEELSALRAVHDRLASGEFFAVIVEPMQSEGGDRYATARFHRALRLLTRHHRVPLIVDEVQTGFGLGGPFVWHSKFGYVDRDGKPDVPDCVTFAKRAQVGVVMSHFPDPEPTSTHAASLWRGRIHADIAVESEPIARDIEGDVRERLADLARRYPELVQSPRNRGYAFAFDLPTPEQLQAFVGQRFWRGAIVFGAGRRTARYRLHRGFGSAEIDGVFEAIRRSLAWLEAHPGRKAPAWEDAGVVDRGAASSGPPVGKAELRIRTVGASDKSTFIDAIEALENEVYEPARRDSRAELEQAFDDPDAVAIVAEAREKDQWILVGHALAVPLERRAQTPGPKEDPWRGQNTTLYSIAVTVDPRFRGQGLGLRLKQAQVREAADRKRADRTARYHYISGRNRVGRTAAMQRINRALGAFEVLRLEHQYEGDATATYYRLPVRGFVPNPLPAKGQSASATGLDLASGIARPLQTPPASLQQEWKAGALMGPAVSKVTLLNYVTPPVVRAIEWVTSLLPDLPHLYLASSRDEAFDKTVRLFRCSRSQGQVVLGLRGGYVGHTAASARSLSDPTVHAQGPVYFEAWSRTPHPAEVGDDEARRALDQAVEHAGGPERVLGLFLEPVQERTGYVLPRSFYAHLEAFRDRWGIPVAFVEHATASYRSGRGAFCTNGLEFTPDVCLWRGGGQIAFVHVGAQHFVAKPMTLVSTWDGDELSLLRVHHQLRAARRVEVSERAQALGQALHLDAQGGVPVRGEGLYRVLVVGDRAQALVGHFATQNIRARAFPNGCVAVAPPLDVTDAQLGHLRAALDAFA